MNDRIQKLSRLFLKFPGIGERQARRFAFFLLAQHPEYIDELSSAMQEARSAVHECQKCFRLHESSDALCSICGNPSRDQAKLVVVEKQADLEAIEKTNFNGIFFILGGLVPIVEKKAVAKTRMSAFLERLARDTSLEEIILAFPLTPNGDHTDSYLRELLQQKFPNHFKITSLGRGLSLGAELEYIDPQTLEISISKRE